MSGESYFNPALYGNCFPWVLFGFLVEVLKKNRPDMLNFNSETPLVQPTASGKPYTLKQPIVCSDYTKVWFWQPAPISTFRNGTCGHSVAEVSRVFQMPRWAPNFFILKKGL